MAAVKSSSPPDSSSPGTDGLGRNSLHAMAVHGRPATEAPRKPLPLPPLAQGSARLREARVSPIRVNFQHENWPQPSNADIELALSQATLSPTASTRTSGSLAEQGSFRPLSASDETPRFSTAPTKTSGSESSQKPLPPLFTPNHRQRFSSVSIDSSMSPADGGPVLPLALFHDRQRPSTASIGSPGSIGVEKAFPPMTTAHERQRSDTGSARTPGTTLGNHKMLPSLPASTNEPNQSHCTPRTVSTIRFSHSPLDLSLSATSRNGPGRPPTVANSKVPAKNHDEFRNSRESDGTDCSAPQPGSVNSSVSTSASSISVANDKADCSPDDDLSPGDSAANDPTPKNYSIPLFQYHHQPKELPQRVDRAPSAPSEPGRSVSDPELLDNAGPIRRHLTPTSGYWARGSLSRPQSSYSSFSDHGSRGRSPSLMPGGSHMRVPSTHSRKSPDSRSSTYAELLNVPYPQKAPAMVSLDNSNLRNAVGNNASLLSVDKTLDMYRQNVKKTNDFSIQYSFAVFLVSTAQEQGLDFSEPKPRKSSRQTSGDADTFEAESPVSNSYELVREARQILQRLASGGYPFAQYYLADGYASGLFSKGKEDYNAAFPLFVLAAKHGHAESAYRTALCYEFGWGCRKDPSKAVQFLRSAASKRHPGAMTRLGKACLSGDLGEKRYREGIKWMKLATEAADAQYNAAPYQLGCLYETGYGDDIFQDLGYAAELFTQAAELGHPEANYRMGEAYEHGRLNCPRDPALSVHFYTGAAERGHAGAMMGLCAWYMVGAPPILEKDEEEAYEWARRSADLGYVKAQYAAGYFTEMGIGCRRDMLEANVWYVQAADGGDERAKQRLAVIQSAASGDAVPIETAPPRSGKTNKTVKDDKDCVIM